MNTVKFSTERVGNSLQFQVTMELASDIAQLTVSELEKVVRSAIVKELESSPVFAEAVRKMAIERLLKLIEKEQP